VRLQVTREDMVSYSKQLSIPFRYHPEWPVCLVPPCNPEQQELHPAKLNNNPGRFWSSRAIPALPGEIQTPEGAGTGDYLVKTAYLRIKVRWPGAKLETCDFAQAGTVGRRRLWVFLFSKCVDLRPGPRLVHRIGKKNTVSEFL
jgi:hypothetical protein